MRALIVAGGSIEDDFAKQWLLTARPDLMIAADSGMEFFYRISMAPDVIVGDLDSASRETIAYFTQGSTEQTQAVFPAPGTAFLASKTADGIGASSYLGNEKKGIRWERLNPVKDDTDTEHALRLAIDEGADEITILGGTGTRLDHVLGNLALLGVGMKRKIPVALVDSHNRIRMIEEPVRIRKEEQFGRYVSLIAYGNPVTGITLTGMKYPLSEYELSPFSPLGISNEIVEEEAYIRFRTGILIVVESRDDPPKVKE